MDYAGRNKDGVAGAKDASLAIDPLLDLSGDNDQHLFLVRVLVKIVSFARIEVDVDHG